MTARIIEIATARRVRGAVADATHAASVHNSQPWRFVVGRSRVELWLDPRNRPTVIDPEGRLALASIGAAAANLELGLRCRLQREVRLDLLPGAVAGLAPPGAAEAPARNPVAIATWGAATSVATASELKLHDAIPSRHTTRQPLYGGVSASAWEFVHDVVAPAPPEAEAAIGSAAPVGSVRPDDAQTAMLLDLVADVDRRWRHDVAYLAEIERWSHARAGRGVPRGAHGPRDASGRVAARDFSVGVAGDHWRPADAYFEISPQLLVITTPGDDAQAWVRAGHAMQRAMLAATARGLDVGVLGQLVEDPAARRRAGVLLGVDGSTVQQVLRLGRPGADRAPGRTPRRQLRTVISG
ncbi:nitroreductase family protein [Pengzhenrongella sicca]|uniref:Nitroreductase family protein n=1 Tax=Pengzhenrongella sicca TaxID=2819238 RepID=A0A8A4ZHT2_9MICO|nr:nitroreductase family protein [Pengzhenrongella sicca]QTE30825.1 nitroreductase family protein [Pengzhenrongella sicca]